MGIDVSLSFSSVLSIHSSGKRKRDDSSLEVDSKDVESKKRRVESSFLEKVEELVDCVFVKPSALCLSAYKMLAAGKLFCRYKRIVFPDRRVYQGETKGGVPYGHGVLTKLDRSRYEGEFVEGKPHGYGILKISNVVEYEGQFQKGCFHGFGVSKHFDGSTYEGEFKEDLFHGFGELVCFDGGRYRGHFVEGMPHGKGISIDAMGNLHDGDWAQGEMHGKGRFVDRTGKFQVEGNWIHDRIISNINNLSDPLFFDLLCGSRKMTPPNGYCLGIFQDYLEQKGYSEMANSLKEAQRYSFFSKEEAEKESHVIHRELNKGMQSKLIAYGFSGHDMGLKLMSSISPGFILCKIFNTGEGVEKYHEKDPADPKKYKLQLQVKVLRESLTPKTIETLLLSQRRSQNANEAYGHILHLRGAEVLSSISSSWKKTQKGNDCSLLWIEEALEDEMPGQRKSIRQSLKQDCREAQILDESLWSIMDMQLWEQEG
ncbi:MAG TPA: hypothetical protein DCE71_06715 [Parachlamydiales bacterium]|nr:hypothetical protein [Parachlamydiales bacterium]